MLVRESGRTGAATAGGGGGDGSASVEVEGGLGEKPAATGRAARGLEGEDGHGDDEEDDDDDLKPAFLRKRKRR